MSISLEMYREQYTHTHVNFFLHKLDQYDNNKIVIITLFTLKNGSVSSIVKAGIKPCVAIIKYTP